jgi:hypothetical protein
MRARLLAILAATWCGLSGAAAFAQSTYEFNFDTTFPAFGYGFGYSGYGELDYSAVDTSGQTPSTWNVATPPAATASLNTTNWALPGYETYTYCGWGLGIGIGFTDGKRPASGDLSKYTLSFDVKVEGYDPGDDGIRTDMKIIFQGPAFADDDYVIGVNGADMGAHLGNFTEVPLLTSTVQTFSHPLSDFAILNDTEWDFPTLFAEATQVLVEMQPSTNRGEIGIDNDNILTVDNLKLEGPFGDALGGDFDGDNDVDGADLLTWQVGGAPGGVTAGNLQAWRDSFGQVGGVALAAGAIPEPGCLALAGVAALRLLCIRRRAPRSA